MQTAIIIKPIPTKSIVKTGVPRNTTIDTIEESGSIQESRLALVEPIITNPLVYKKKVNSVAQRIR